MRLSARILGAALLLAAVGLAGATGVAQAAGTQRFVSPAGTNNPTCLQANPCKTVTAGLAAAVNGDTINLAAGSYAEQVVIAKSVTIHGAGKNQTTIAAPATFVLDSHGETEIVQVTAAATVAIDRLTVAGPAAAADSCAPDAVTLDYGIFVVGNATLALSNAAVNDIFNGTFNGPLSGCQIGGAIRYGSNFYTESAHGSVTNVTVNRYQKGGIIIDGTGTTATVSGNTVTDQPEMIIASNGIQISRNAIATVANNTVTGNECNAPVPTCGPDLFSSEAWSTGILTFGAGRSTFTGNTVTGNDIGIALDADAAGDRVDNNQSTNNRYAGLAVFGGQSYAIQNNSLGNNGEYGIVLSADGSGVSRSNITGNTAFNDGKKDMYADTNSRQNTFTANDCATAVPSLAFWGCDGNGGRF